MLELKHLSVEQSLCLLDCKPLNLLCQRTLMEGAARAIQLCDIVLVMPYSQHIPAVCLVI